MQSIYPGRSVAGLSFKVSWLVTTSTTLPKVPGKTGDKLGNPVNSLRNSNKSTITSVPDDALTKLGILLNGAQDEVAAL